MLHQVGVSFDLYVCIVQYMFVVMRQLAIGIGINWRAERIYVLLPLWLPDDRLQYYSLFTLPGSLDGLFNILKSDQLYFKFPASAF